VTSDRDAIIIALSALTEPQREVLRLAAWEGLNARDAAAVLDCTPSTFRVRLYRARTEFAKQLDAAGHLPSERAATPRCETADQAE
jgi:RNA polymerase sigma-70 factor (ECF subfamily)